MNSSQPGIPVVSLYGWRNGDHLKSTVQIQKLGDAVSKFGFVSCTGHGIKAKTVGDLYRSAEELFDRGEEYLTQFDRPDLHRQVGYTPLRAETSKGAGQPNHMHFWHVLRDGQPHENVWPKEGTFEPCAREMYQELDALSVAIFEMLAIYAGLPPSYFTDMIRDGASLLRIIDYPEIPKAEVDGFIRSAQHEDICLGTLLTATAVSGLEIHTDHSGWMSVQNPPGSVIFNTGDMMALHTSWHPEFPNSVEYPSTTHRVVPTHKRRMSAPFFVHPRYEVKLLPGYTAEMALLRRLDQIYGIGHEQGE